jgi:lysophospholipase L1-like esterase/glucose/arabinose dehydrogenase
MFKWPGRLSPANGKRKTQKFEIMNPKIHSTKIKQLGLAIALGLGAATTGQALELNKGDHVVLIGNALAERMQHHGWLESYAQAAMPDKELVFRNHGFGGDKVNNRPRNSGFPSADAYLEISKADVILAFWGYNESFDNSPDAYRADLAKWIDETNGKKYNGKSAPRIVLFSPIAHEDLGQANLPDGSANNERLAKYTEATRQVANEKGVEFVDLFSHSQKLYARSKTPLTINGIHLTSGGNNQLARSIHKSLFGKLPRIRVSKLSKINAAVLDKNWHWYNRYRATDGNDVWGGRSKLAFVADQTNRVVLQQELKMIDVMTANRDKVIHAAVNGKKIQADDSNVPSPVKVVSNVGGGSKSSNAAKEGTVKYAKPEETLAKLKLAPKMKANVFASEEMFDNMINPVQMGVDTKGRLWVAVWPTYPKWEPLKETNDALVILPDENRDGVADKMITFAKVQNPTGFEFWNGGVIVASAPDLIFLKDTDGDDVADVRERLLHGLDSADTHHAANNLVYGPGGYIYYQRGVFHVSNVETPWSGPRKDTASAMYRFNPRTFKFSHHANNSPNPHGISFDYWGYHYATDGTGGRAYQVRPNGKGGFKMQTLLKKTVRPVCSSGILSSDHFPQENNGNFLILNAIGFLGIKQYTLEYDDEGDVWGTETDDLLVSDDRNLRPTDFEIGDDGALYVSDWQNVIVGHMQHNVRDPNRNKTHGRIYRVTCEGRPLSKHVNVDGQSISELLDLLKHPINGIRQRARVELSEHPSDKTLAATDKWLAQFDPKAKEDAHHFLEALWVYQRNDTKNEALLKQVLNSPVEHARNAAKTVKQFWDNNL